MWISRGCLDQSTLCTAPAQLPVPIDTAENTFKLLINKNKMGLSTDSPTLIIIGFIYKIGNYYYEI